MPAHAAHCFQSSALRALPLTPTHLFPAIVCAHRPLMRFGAYETAPQRVHTATGLGLVLSLVLLSCSSRTGTAFRSGRFSFGQEWDGGGGKSLSFTGVLGQSNGQESHTYRNRFGKTCLFSSDIGPHRQYWAKRPRVRASCPFYRQCVAHSAANEADETESSSPDQPETGGVTRSFKAAAGIERPAAFHGCVYLPLVP